MVFKERESYAVVKSTKMLVHYLHHFGQIRNVMFRVWNTIPVNGLKISPINSNDIEFEISLEIFPVKSSIKTKEGVYKPMDNDVQKLGTMVDLCPDLVAIDKRMVKDRLTYTIQSVNHDLPFIRSDFFKL